MSEREHRRRCGVTQTVLTTVPTQHATNHPSIQAIGPMLALHGSDPLTGIPATWHVTSLADDGASGSFLIERAEGEIHSPAPARHCAREIATLIRLRSSRKSIPRGTSAGDDAAVVTSTTTACWPWYLSLIHISEPTRRTP